jgi:hypothetical protein
VVAASENVSQDEAPIQAQPPKVAPKGMSMMEEMQARMKKKSESIRSNNTSNNAGEKSHGNTLPNHRSKEILTSSETSTAPAGLSKEEITAIIRQELSTFRESLLQDFTNILNTCRKE